MLDNPITIANATTIDALFMRILLSDNFLYRFARKNGSESPVIVSSNVFSAFTMPDVLLPSYVVHIADCEIHTICGIITPENTTCCGSVSL
jgi:hypothetical protein